MAQPSVAAYFNSRKRLAVDDTKLNQAKKVLVLDASHLDKPSIKGSHTLAGNVQTKNKSETFIQIANKVTIASTTSDFNKKTVVHKCKSSKMKKVSKNSNIQEALNNMIKKKPTVVKVNTIVEELNNSPCLTPPSTPTKKVNAMDKMEDKPDGPTIKEIRRKMSRSARLSELKSSLNRFQESAKKLKEVEDKTSQILQSPKLKTFKTIELEVQTSPRKVFSPEKAYLSPKKDTTARRNLFTSPTKSSVSAQLQSPSKELSSDSHKSALTLPYKYRSLAELFRAIDTVVQILFNRKEIITFRKLKPAVEELSKRNLLETHLAKIKHIYPEAFCFNSEKLKSFGSGMKTEQWELVIKPNIDDEHMTPEILLQRRRKLFNLLLDKVKGYHEEYLLNLPTPLHISKDKITRWHPEFDIERLPDIEQAEICQAPKDEKLSTGKHVLEKARVLFNCNTRMEQALERLKKVRDENADTEKVETTEMPTSILKGIPKALLEKVRQKQAAKALVTITRTADKEKELQIYLRLPELARLTRNIFVSEKKSVLPLDVLVEKLGNCYRGNLTKTEMEDHLKVISKEVTGWLIFHDIRNCMYIKLLKNADLFLVINKLENLIKEKSEF